MKENKFICYECEKEYEGDYCLYDDGEKYCITCFNELFFCCNSCNNFCDREEAIVTTDGCEICESCYNEYFASCESCGEIDCIDDLMYDDYSYNYYCSHCYHNICQEMGLHNYNYSPDNIIFYSNNESRKDNLHIGIELEIQGGDRYSFCQEFMNEYDDDKFFYLKSDGSLDTSGVEIVSQPMTYNYIMNTSHWEDVFKIMNSNYMDNISGCGLHFHLDKEYLTDDNIKVIDYIVNNFSEYFEKMGGRPFNGYCRKTYKSINDWGVNTDNRYCAVNLENDNTVELRFCESTDDYDNFIKRVKLIFAIVEFAKTHSFKNTIKIKNIKKCKCFLNITF